MRVMTTLCQMYSRLNFDGLTAYEDRDEADEDLAAETADCISHDIELISNQANPKLLNNNCHVYVILVVAAYAMNHSSVNREL